mmetsp:Transcript_62429/g.98965  ORF Transcript_62429/g.98965 Transcript_62429/m.98965 type:complete len:234 (+) Transcript_62429:275-976(+)
MAVLKVVGSVCIAVTFASTTATWLEGTSRLKATFQVPASCLRLSNLRVSSTVIVTRLSSIPNSFAKDFLAEVATWSFVNAVDMKLSDPLNVCAASGVVIAAVVVGASMVVAACPVVVAIGVDVDVDVVVDVVVVVVVVVVVAVVVVVVVVVTSSSTIAFWRIPQDTRPPSLLWTMKGLPVTPVLSVLTRKTKSAKPAEDVLLYLTVVHGSSPDMVLRWPPCIVVLSHWVPLWT